MSSSAQTAKLDALPVMETFLTIQGEGFHSGKAAYFIRLGGCDVGCTWCDVKESWEAGHHPLKAIAELVAEVKSSNASIAVITGGEPFMYDLNRLTSGLRAEGIYTHVETAGVYPITGTWDWICFSPKKFKKPIQEYYDRASELKVIAFNKSDLQWCEGHADLVNQRCELFLQPEWSKKDAMTPMIVDYVKKNPKWRISLQTHKYMNIP